MSILDAKLEFSDAQALASISSGNSTVSTNVADLGATGKDGWGNAVTLNPGEGQQMVFNVTVDTALVGASAAVICRFVSKASSASISASGTEHARVTLAATAAKGTRASIPIPAGTIYRYAGVLYTASGGKLTSAKVNAWLGLDHETPSA